MIRRSLLYSFADKTAGSVLSLATMVVVSRMLTPAEVGLFLVASTVVILGEALRDFGLGACIVQARDLTTGLVRTAFTIMAGLSALVAGALYLATDRLAAFYGEPELARLIHIGLIGFFIAPFGNPVLALLRRDMAFGRLALINVGCALVTATATVALALAGFGASSMVWASIAAAATSAGAAFLARPDIGVYRPSLSCWRELAPFGLWSSLFTMLAMAMDAGPRLILGRTLGFAGTGLFTRAVTLCQLPDRTVLSALQPVILPAMAELVRSGGDLRRAFLLGVANVTAVQWPALVVLALLADPAVAILLGGQWTEAAGLARVIALATLTQFTVPLTYPVLVALGRVRDLVVISALTLPPSLAALYAASLHGAEAAALSLVATGALQAGVALAVIRRRIGFGWGALAGALLRSAGAAAGAAAGAGAVMLATGAGFAMSAPQAVAALLAAALGWVIAIRLARHPLHAECLRAATGAAAFARRRVGGRGREVPAATAAAD